MVTSVVLRGASYVKRIVSAYRLVEPGPDVKLPVLPEVLVGKYVVWSGLVR